MLRLKRAELQKKVEEDQARLARIEARLQQMDLAGGSGPSPEGVVKPVEATLAASIRDIIPRSQLVRLFAELKDHLRVHGAGQVSGPVTVLWHDCSSCDDSADVEVAYPLTKEISGSQRVQVAMLPAVPMAASLVHQCDPYSVCRATSELAMWIEANGYRVSDMLPSREIFFSLGDEAEGRLHVAEVQVPVELA